MRKREKIGIVCILAALLLCGCLQKSQKFPLAEQTEAQTKLQTERQTEQAAEQTDPAKEKTTSCLSPEQVHPPRQGLQSEEPLLAPVRPQVLMYHAVSDTPFSPLTSLFVRPADLRAHIDALQQQGYRFYFADEYAERPEKSVILTFDDGYEDNYTELFPILQESGAVATVFLIQNCVGQKNYLSEEQILQMQASGLVRFGCHTADHVDLAGQSAQEMKEQMQSCKRYLEALLGEPCRSVAYPYGSYNENVCRAAGELFSFGYTTDNPCRFAKTGNAPMALPRHYISRGMSAVGVLERLDGE